MSLPKSKVVQTIARLKATLRELGAKRGEVECRLEELVALEMRADNTVHKLERFLEEAEAPTELPPLVEDPNAKEPLGREVPQGPEKDTSTAPPAQ